MQEQIVERYSGQIGNALEGKGYIHATHQGMSKFGSRLETGYVRVADVVEDFVLEATKAMESKRLPRSNIATGQYTGSSKNSYKFVQAPNLRRNSFANVSGC